MLQKDTSNTIFSLAVDLVNDTSQHIFLTGKAGTGKTTFLKHVRECTRKNTVVVAPTGVAAINAGGVTMHSFFQLPRGVFVPGTIQRDGLLGYVESNDRHSLFKNIHFTSNKRQLLQELELLIIDEVSMMRCDMLDAIDTILRHFRKAPLLPFGGVQVLYIGDMYQLPPVVQNEEWEILKQYYESPFFFHSKAVAEAQPLYVELQKIYRQNEANFIDVLNRIRNNNPQPKDFHFLNERFQPDFVSTPDDHYITITTHNKKAEAINTSELNKLPGRLHTFKASVKDEFSDKAFPTELELQLKEGAQVMFIKNDTSAERRYFNGKLATVIRIKGEDIVVEFADGGEEFTLEKETWQNIRYIYSKDNDDIDEEVLGSFTQFPIRLAWAITVHKSQGLTFEKAIIDAGSSFAAGQVYVALSRCISLQGLILKSKIHPFAVSTDKRIVEFASKAVDDTRVLEEVLEKEKYRFWAQSLVKTFDFQKLVAAIFNWMRIIPEKKLPDNEGALALAQQLLQEGRSLMEVGSKFQRQLENILAQVQVNQDTVVLEERMVKAIGYFGDLIASKILAPLQQHKKELSYTSRITKYKEELKSVESFIWNALVRMVEAKYGKVVFLKVNPYLKYDPDSTPVSKEKSVSPAKGNSSRLTLDLFREGKTIDEICSLRNLAASTVESHLAPFVLTGEVEASALIPVDKLDAIVKVLEESGAVTAGVIKAKMGDDFSFHEIRVAMNHLRFSQKQTA